MLLSTLLSILVLTKGSLAAYGKNLLVEERHLCFSSRLVEIQCSCRAMRTPVEAMLSEKVVSKKPVSTKAGKYLGFLFLS